MIKTKIIQYISNHRSEIIISAILLSFVASIIIFVPPQFVLDMLGKTITLVLLSTLVSVLGFFLTSLLTHSRIRLLVAIYVFSFLCITIFIGFNVFNTFLLLCFIIVLYYITT